MLILIVIYNHVCENLNECFLSFVSRSASSVTLRPAPLSVHNNNLPGLLKFPATIGPSLYANSPGYHGHKLSLGSDFSEGNFFLRNTSSQCNKEKTLFSKESQSQSLKSLENPESAVVPIQSSDYNSGDRNPMLTNTFAFEEKEQKPALPLKLRKKSKSFRHIENRDVEEKSPMFGLNTPEPFSNYFSLGRIKAGNVLNMNNLMSFGQRGASNSSRNDDFKPMIPPKTSISQLLKSKKKSKSNAMQNKVVSNVEQSLVPYNAAPGNSISTSHNRLENQEASELVYQKQYDNENEYLSRSSRTQKVLSTYDNTINADYDMADSMSQMIYDTVPFSAPNEGSVAKGSMVNSSSADYLRNTPSNSVDAYSNKPKFTPSSTYANVYNVQTSNSWDVTDSSLSLDRLHPKQPRVSLEDYSGQFSSDSPGEIVEGINKQLVINTLRQQNLASAAQDVYKECNSYLADKDQRVNTNSVTNAEYYSLTPGDVFPSSELNKSSKKRPTNLNLGNFSNSKIRNSLDPRYDSSNNNPGFISHHDSPVSPLLTNFVPLGVSTPLDGVVPLTGNAKLQSISQGCRTRDRRDSYRQAVSNHSKKKDLHVGPQISEIPEDSNAPPYANARNKGASNASLPKNNPTEKNGRDFIVEDPKYEPIWFQKHQQTNNRRENQKIITDYDNPRRKSLARPDILGLKKDFQNTDSSENTPLVYSIDFDEASSKSGKNSQNPVYANFNCSNNAHDTLQNSSEPLYQLPFDARSQENLGADKKNSGKFIFDIEKYK